MRFRKPKLDLIDSIVLFLLILIAISPLVIKDQSANKILGACLVVAVLILEFYKKTKIEKRSKKKEKETRQEIKKIRQIVEETKIKKEKEIKKLQGESNLISKFIRKGLISENIIFENIKGKRFFYLFCYQKVEEQEEITKIVGRDFRNPSLLAVEELGFIKVGTRHNFYILPLEYLPKKLQNIEKLESFIRKLVQNKWSDFLKNLKEKDSDFYKNYMTTYPKPTNYTYFLSETNFHDVIIGYIGYNAFSSKFKAMINHYIDIRKLRSEIKKRKHKIKKFILSISYDLFLENVPIKYKELIIKNEQKINKKLRVSNFIAYKDRREDLYLELAKFLDDKKANEYSKKICNSSTKYYRLFLNLGIDLE